MENNVGMKPLETKVVVHAKWVWNEEYECYFCSNCNARNLYNHRGIIETSPHCPKCGATMDEV